MRKDKTKRERRAVGWILDIYIQKDEAVLWIRTENDEILRLRDRYEPEFYVEPRGKEEARFLFHELLKHPHVKEILLENRFTTLDAESKNELLRVIVDDAFGSKEIVNKVKESSHVEKVYSSDLLHVQQYIFRDLKIAPTSKIRIEYDESEFVRSVTRVDDDAEIEPPPFTTLFFFLHSESMDEIPRPQTDPVTRIDVWYQGEEKCFTGDEAEILEGFARYVREVDPDFLVAPECDDLTFPYLLARVRSLRMDLQLGREHVDVHRLQRPLPYWIRGRVALNYHLWNYTFEEWGLSGVVERARFSMLPPGIAWRWTANRIIDSRNCYELIQRGYAIKEDHEHYQWARSIRNVYERDVGGIIFAPKIGEVHENVGEIDFHSMYPELIVKHCISYETVSPEGIRPREDALLPNAVKEILERRLYFKKLRKKFPEESEEWRWCEQRQQSLKLVLVCAYGTSGCCWNRFGNVLAFEEINKRSREAMLTAVHLSQRLGFEVVYGDTDSLFLKKKGASGEDYERLCDLISEEVGLPIGLDHHYRFLLLLPSKTDPTGAMEAQKHYLGILTNGETVTRGIEIRRHDTPLLVKNFQLELIQRFLGWETTEQVMKKGMEAAESYAREVEKRIMEGEVSVEDLVVRKYLRKPLSAYDSDLPHVSAARQLTERGTFVKKGDKVAYVFVDADHENPLCRVQPIESFVDDPHYDREKYRDLLLRAAETVLSQFGFSKEEFTSSRGVKPLLEEETGEKTARLGRWIRKPRHSEPIFAVRRSVDEGERYVLRLEWEGAVKTWVLSGRPPLEVGVRTPGINLEDQPAGSLNSQDDPYPGDHGGEAAEVWDAGTYSVKVWSKQMGLFHMDGERMKGDYLLRRIGEYEEENRWMLSKRREMKI